MSSEKLRNGQFLFIPGKGIWQRGILKEMGLDIGFGEKNKAGRMPDHKNK